MNECERLHRVSETMAFCGKTAIVTGGAGGIGHQICCQLLSNHITNLAIVDIVDQPDSLSSLPGEFPSTSIAYFECDISVEKDLKRTLNEIQEKFGTIDILINSAGIFNDRDVELTLRAGPIHATLLGVGLMSKEKGGNGGVVINIASMVGLDPLHLMPVYSASKQAIIGFSRAFSHDDFYERSGVKLIAVCPGATTTNFLRNYPGKMIHPLGNSSLAFLRAFPKQSAHVVAEHVVDVLRNAQNGTVWLSDNSQLTQVEMHEYNKM